MMKSLGPSSIYCVIIMQPAAKTTVVLALELQQFTVFFFDDFVKEGYNKFMNINNRIVINPRIMRGKPVIKGTRIPVYAVLNLLAEGYDVKRIIKEYPDLTKEDILASVKFASRITSFEEHSQLAIP